MRINVVWFWLLACFVAVNAVGQEVKLDGMAILKISADNITGEIPVAVRVFHSFPMVDNSMVFDTLSKAKPLMVLQCPVRVAQEGQLELGDRVTGIMMRPGDTINVVLEGNEVRFLGNSADIQYYYLEKSKRFPIPVGQLMLDAGGSAATLGKFQQIQDSLADVERRFFDEMNGKVSASRKNTLNRKLKLPAWFVRYESDAMRYYDAHRRLYALGYREWTMKKKEPVPQGYFSFLESLQIKNEEALYDHEYVMFLREYFHYRAGRPQREYLKEEIELSKSMLGERVAAFYMLSSIGSRLVLDPGSIQRALDQYSPPSSFQYLYDYLLQRAGTRLTELAVGAPAPEFYLVDKLDSLVSLSQFSDQVVYLSFWFAGCKPCIAEIPHENELVREFSDKPVKIISVCTHTSREKWLEAIRVNNLTAVNLFANPAWQNKLEENYAISAYPHYVLIGKNGKVIDNFAKRPSQGVAKDIEAALGEK